LSSNEAPHRGMKTLLKIVLVSGSDSSSIRSRHEENLDSRPGLSSAVVTFFRGNDGTNPNWEFECQPPVYTLSGTTKGAR